MTSTCTEKFNYNILQYIEINDNIFEIISLKLLFWNNSIDPSNIDINNKNIWLFNTIRLINYNNIKSKYITLKITHKYDNLDYDCFLLYNEIENKLQIKYNNNIIDFDEIWYSNEFMNVVKKFYNVLYKDDIQFTINKTESRRHNHNKSLFIYQIIRY